MDLYTHTRQNIPVGWEELFVISDPEIKQISDILEEEKAKRIRVVPDQENIFRVFHMCKPENLNVVILGQDPYHQILSNGKARALGFSFSVGESDEVPISLKNIYKEIQNSYSNVEIPKHGDISHWVTQGVFLLNICLTCRANEANSHGKYKLWMPFIDRFIKFMSNVNKNLIFVLWGGEAQKMESVIEKHFTNILKAPHPSGLSASRGFFGCNHFRMINDKLESQSKPQIEWLSSKPSLLEAQVMLLSATISSDEMNQLTPYYRDHFVHNSLKFKTLEDYTVYVICYTVHQQKNDSSSLTDFLSQVYKKLTDNDKMNFYHLVTTI
jgi:uracil-DNA glycosylase